MLRERQHVVERHVRVDAAQGLCDPRLESFKIARGPHEQMRGVERAERAAGRLF